MAETGDKATGGGAGAVFGFFNEVGILSQLSSALLARALPEGLHPSHFAIINHLVRMGDGKTPVRIAAAMQVTKTTMTHSLRVLEERGFVTTGPNPDDARGKLVYLTAAGRAFREAAIARIGEKYGGLFGPREIARMQAIQADLTALRKHLDANRLTGG